MKKLFLLLLIFVACGNGDEAEISRYERLAQWDFHPSYQFLLTDVDELGESLVLRGSVARDVLTPEEVAAARTTGSIEINGEIFVHTSVNIEGNMITDQLYGTLSGQELGLMMAFFGDFEGDDPRYRMVTNVGTFHHFFKHTEIYREFEINTTTPMEIYRLVVEQMEWGPLEMFAPFHTTALAIANPTDPEIPTHFPFGGSFLPFFENGICTFLRWLP
jgi:hypothetical protein